MHARMYVLLHTCLDLHTYECADACVRAHACLHACMCEGAGAGIASVLSMDVSVPQACACACALVIHVRNARMIRATNFYV